jgi:holin-like protein
LKQISQIAIILLISFIGEVLNKLLDLPIPASIYGLIIMLICLETKIIKIEKIEKVANLLLELMPIMFIPASVGIIAVGNEVKNIVLPISIIIFLTTIIVMVTTGKVTQFIILKDRCKKE